MPASVSAPCSSSDRPHAYVNARIYLCLRVCLISLVTCPHPASACASLLPVVSWPISAIAQLLGQCGDGGDAGMIELLISVLEWLSQSRLVSCSQVSIGLHAPASLAMCAGFELDVHLHARMRATAPPPSPTLHVMMTRPPNIILSTRGPAAVGQRRAARGLLGMVHLRPHAPPRAPAPAPRRTHPRRAPLQVSGRTGAAGSLSSYACA